MHPRRTITHSVSKTQTGWLPIPQITIEVVYIIYKVQIDLSAYHCYFEKKKYFYIIQMSLQQQMLYLAIVIILFVLA